MSNDDYWIKYAKKYQVRLPHSDTVLTSGKCEFWLKKLGISPAQYKEVSGLKRVRDFVEFNPEWTLRGFVGLLLEGIESGQFKALQTEKVT